MLNRIRPILALGCIVLLTGLACGLSDFTSGPLQVGPLPTTAPATQTLPPVLPADTVTPLPVPTAESYAVRELAEGLSELDSYTARFVLLVKGSRPDGSPLEQEIRVEQQTLRSQDTRRLHMAYSGQTGAAGDVEIIQAGDDTFLSGIEGLGSQCILATSAEEDPFVNFGAYRPEQIFSRLQPEKLIEQGVLVNGVASNHYSLAQVSLSFGLVFQRADIWIAQDSPLVMRFSGEAMPGNESFLIDGPLAEGVIAWDYQLGEVNSLAGIPIPPACLEAAEKIRAIPLPANIFDKATYGGMMTFTTPDPVDLVADFYRQELPGQGWQVDEKAASQTLVILVASKADQVIQILISKGENFTSVMITPNR